MCYVCRFSLENGSDPFDRHFRIEYIVHVVFFCSCSLPFSSIHQEWCCVYKNNLSPIVLIEFDRFFQSKFNETVFTRWKYFYLFGCNKRNRNLFSKHFSRYFIQFLFIASFSAILKQTNIVNISVLTWIWM